VERGDRSSTHRNIKYKKIMKLGTQTELIFLSEFDGTTLA